MRTLAVRELRRELIAFGPERVSDALPDAPGDGPARLEAEAYEALANRRTGAAFMRLRAAEAAWRAKPDASEADACEEAAAVLFRATYPPHGDDDDTTSDVAAWLLSRLRVLSDSIESRVQRRAAPPLETLHDSDERRHRWLFRLLAGRGAGVRYALDQLCEEAGLSPEDHVWLSMLLAVEADRAVLRLATSLAGESPPRPTAGLLAECFAESPREVRAMLRRLDPGAPLRRESLVGLIAPWPGSPIAITRITISASAVARLDASR